jgi:hypothetical protein
MTKCVGRVVWTRNECGHDAAARLDRSSLPASLQPSLSSSVRDRAIAGMDTFGGSINTRSR